MLEREQQDRSVSAEPVEVFFSYSHKDEELRDQLEAHLSVLKLRGMITTWHDRKIGAGQEWAGMIDQHLETADVILPLISADFLSSAYCYDVEMKQAMKRHEARQAYVVPIILRPVVWQGTLFGKFQALPKDGKPVKSELWASVDAAFENVTQGLVSLVESLRRSHQPAAVAATAGQASQDLGQTSPAKPNGAPRPPDQPARVAPSPAAQQTASVRKGFEALAELLRNDSDLRDEAVKFHNDFQVVRHQINLLGDYKDLHDLLHELQVHLYNTICQEARHFPEEETLENLNAYEVRLGLLLQRLDEVTSRPSLPTGQVSWMPKLHEARQNLVEAVEPPDAAKLTAALELMRGVLAIQPSKIDTRLNALAGELRLDNLRKAMTVIYGRVAQLGLSGTKIQEFQAGARNLDALNHKLLDLVQEHYRWQEVDDEFRRIEGRLEMDINELINSWPDIKPKMQPLYGFGTDPRAEEFSKDGEKLQSAIEAKDPTKIRQAFRRFRAHALDRFYEVDKKLRDLSGELRVVGEPLDAILNTLRMNR